MSQASDYQINFPYGATSAPYTVASPHRGDDRPCPSGTPVILGGTTIGLTGATGKVTGPHLHIQEWNGGYANTRKPQNAFQVGTVTNVDLDGTQGDVSFGKFITIQTADGWNDSYCHLSQINVHKGDILGGQMASDKQIDDTINIARILAGFPDSELGKLLDIYRPELKNNYVEGTIQMLKNLTQDPNAAINKPAGGGVYEKVEVYRKVS